MRGGVGLAHAVTMSRKKQIVPVLETVFAIAATTA